jgi:hypothetical protein
MRARAYPPIWAATCCERGFLAWHPNGRYGRARRLVDVALLTAEEVDRAATMKLQFDSPGSQQVALAP